MEKIFQLTTTADNESMEVLSLLNNVAKTSAQKILNFQKSIRPTIFPEHIQKLIDEGEIIHTDLQASIQVHLYYFNQLMNSLGGRTSSLGLSFSEIYKRANLNSKYTFDTFVVGSNNKFAHAAALAVAESPGEIYNPLYLYAGVGLGKTHLMHSIAHFILENDPNKKVLYVTSEEFTNQLIDSIRNGKNNSAMTDFRDKYRNIDVLLIDDIQFIIGKESTQEEFFHTFNALYGSKKQIVISSDKAPKDLNVLEERIKSRLEMGLIADISAPDYETRMAILRKKEELEGYHIDDDIIDYIAKNVKSNIRELEGSLNRIRAKSILEKKDVSLEFAEEILKDYIQPEEEKRITSEMIVEVIAEHFNLSIDEIKSEKRNSKYVYPRKLAMYLCREMTADSLQSIAGLLNRKDHSTVINGIKSIEKDYKTSEETRSDINVLKKKLTSKI